MDHGECQERKQSPMLHPAWVARASRVLAKASRLRELFGTLALEESFWRDAKTGTRDGCATQSNLTAPHTKKDRQRTTAKGIRLPLLHSCPGGVR